MSEFQNKIEQLNQQNGSSPVSQNDQKSSTYQLSKLNLLLDDETLKFINNDSTRQSTLPQIDTSEKDLSQILSPNLTHDSVISNISPTQNFSIYQQQGEFQIMKTNKHFVIQKNTFDYLKPCYQLTNKSKFFQNNWQFFQIKSRKKSILKGQKEKPVNVKFPSKKYQSTNEISDLLSSGYSDSSKILWSRPSDNSKVMLGSTSPQIFSRENGLNQDHYNGNNIEQLKMKLPNNFQESARLHSTRDQIQNFEFRVVKSERNLKSVLPIIQNNNNSINNNNNISNNSTTIANKIQQVYSFHENEMRKSEVKFPSEGFITQRLSDQPLRTSGSSLNSPQSSDISENERSPTKQFMPSKFLIESIQKKETRNSIYPQIVDSPFRPESSLADPDSPIFLKFINQISMNDGFQADQPKGNKYITIGENGSTFREYLQIKTKQIEFIKSLQSEILLVLDKNLLFQNSVQQFSLINIQNFVIHCEKFASHCFSRIKSALLQNSKHFNCQKKEGIYRGIKINFYQRQTLESILKETLDNSSFTIQEELLKFISSEIDKHLSPQNLLEEIGGISKVEKISEIVAQDIQHHYKIKNFDQLLPLIKQFSLAIICNNQLTIDKYTRNQYEYVRQINAVDFYVLQMTVHRILLTINDFQEETISRVLQKIQHLRTQIFSDSNWIQPEVYRFLSERIADEIQQSQSLALYWSPIIQSVKLAEKFTRDTLNYIFGKVTAHNFIQILGDEHLNKQIFGQDLRSSKNPVQLEKLVFHIQDIIIRNLQNINLDQILICNARNKIEKLRMNLGLLTLQVGLKNKTHPFFLTFYNILQNNYLGMIDQVTFSFEEVMNCQFLSFFLLGVISKRDFFSYIDLNVAIIYHDIKADVIEFWFQLFKVCLLEYGMEEPMLTELNEKFYQIMLNTCDIARGKQILNKERN